MDKVRIKKKIAEINETYGCKVSYIISVLNTCDTIAQTNTAFYWGSNLLMTYLSFEAGKTRNKKVKANISLYFTSNQKTLTGAYCEKIKVLNKELNNEKG